MTERERRGTTKLSAVDKPTDKQERSTAKMAPFERGDRISIDLADTRAADFLEYVAKLIREKKRITILIE